MYNLGWCYLKGFGTPLDKTKAAKWYKKAADEGHSQAQIALQNF